MDGLPEGDRKRDATIDITYEAARTEPVAALKLASALPSTPERDALLTHAVSQWAKSDSPTAALWAMKVPDPALRQRLVASVAVVMAERGGDSAVTLAMNGLAAVEDQDRAVVAIVQRWVQHSPQAAAAWVAQFPDVPSRDATVQNLLALWITQDAVAAGDWLRDLPAGSLRDAGKDAYAQAMASASQTPAAVPAGEYAWNGP